MMEPLAVDEWEAWLGQRFVAYLLKDAEGRPRPVAHVEAALVRLSGQPDALSRLAMLAFLLDPDAELVEWLEHILPVYLRRLRVRSEPESDVMRNRVRGRVDWARTLAIRQATQDPTLIASRSLRRTFDTPELVTIRYVLERVRRAAAALVRAGSQRQSGWTSAVFDIAVAAEGIARHSALRSAPIRPPDARERMVARASHDHAARCAARLLEVHDALVPEPTIDRLSEMLARFALTPLNVDARFQVFAMLALIDSVDRVIGPAHRVDRIVASGRDEVVRWTGHDFVVCLHYDQAANAGVHADLMNHYFGTSQSLRPDIRLVLERDGTTRELIADAKRSTSLGYLADAHHKMRGYIADRPEAFSSSMPKAVIVCPSNEVSAPRDSDDVVFVGCAASRAGGVLDGVVRLWWRAPSSTA